MAASCLPAFAFSTAGCNNSMREFGMYKESRMSIEELVAEVKKLSLEDRAALAKWIVESLDDLSESEIETLWAKEAERRLDEL